MILLATFNTPKGTIELCESLNLGIHVRVDGVLQPWASDFKDWVNVRNYINMLAGSEVYPLTWGPNEDTRIFSRAQAV